MECTLVKTLCCDSVFIFKFLCLMFYFLQVAKDCTSLYGNYCLCNVAVVWRLFLSNCK